MRPRSRITWTRSIQKICSSQTWRASELKVYPVDDIDDALGDLRDSRIVVTRDDPHKGHQRYGLKELVERAEEFYLDLKDQVDEKAEACGLSAIWKQGSGWRLVDGSGTTVVGLSAS